MSNVMIGYPNRIDAATVSGGSWLSTLPLNNLKNNILGKVARSSSAAQTATKFDIDFGSLKNIRALALVNHNMTIDAKYRLAGSATTAQNLAPNSSMAGAVAGTPGTTPNLWGGFTTPTGTQRQITAVGVDGDLAYVDVRFYGTCSVAGEGAVFYTNSNTYLAAASGQYYCIGLNMKLIAGTIPDTIYLGLDELNSGGSWLTGSGTAINPTTTETLKEQRFHHGRVLNNGSTAYVRPYVWMPMSNGQVVDFTIRIAAPMVVAGLTPSSHVPTTAGAVTGPDFGDYDDASGLNVSRKYSFPQTRRDWTFSNITTADGVSTMTMTSTTGDPYISNAEANIDGAKAYIAKVRIRRVAGSGWEGSFLWTNPANPAFVGNRVIPFSQPTWDADGWATITIDLRSNMANGGASDFHTAPYTGAVRFDFGSSASDVFELDYIVFGTEPVFNTGSQDVWPIVYPDGTLEWEDENWWTGKYTAEQMAGYTAAMIHVFDANQLARYIRVELTDISNPAGYVQVGRVFVGPAWQPSYNMGQGAQITWATDTTSQKAVGGTSYYQRKNPYRLVSFTIGDLSADEAFSQAFEIQRGAGIDKEVLFIHDPDDTVHALRRRFLGTFTKLDPLTYPYATRNNAAFEIKEIL